jgi:nicotinamide-nucleotide amidase
MMDTTAETLARQLGALLLSAGRMLVTAESCTGGGLAELVTRIAGSSQWFERGYVTYSNAAKQELLDISYEKLEKYGAVSEQTALTMAEGALEHSHASIGVAITGIAGPEGGTDDKPVGTVCLAWVDRSGYANTARIRFKGNRLQVREQACLLALQGLVDILEKQVSAPGD